ncbi:MAG: tyrosine-type recombinase/integrase [Gemmatimonadaceae bacterium]
MRFHDLRHSYASIMAAAGVDIYKVSRWMGHANVSTTDSIYTHLFQADFDADMARLDAYVADAPEVKRSRDLSRAATPRPAQR